MQKTILSLSLAALGNAQDWDTLKQCEYCPYGGEFDGTVVTPLSLDCATAINLCLGTMWATCAEPLGGPEPSCESIGMLSTGAGCCGADAQAAMAAASAGGGDAADGGDGGDDAAAEWDATAKMKFGECAAADMYTPDFVSTHESNTASLTCSATKSFCLGSAENWSTCGGDMMPNADEASLQTFMAAYGCCAGTTPAPAPEASNPSPSPSPTPSDSDDDSEGSFAPASVVSLGALALAAFAI